MLRACMQGKKATQLELATLSKLLRVGRLAESVREGVLPDVRWFTLGPLLRVFSIIYRRARVNIIKQYPHMEFPEAWVAKARIGYTPIQIRQARAEFVWRVPASEVLGLMHAKKRKSLQSPFYAKGAFFEALLTWSPDEGLGVFLVLTGDHGYPEPTLLGVNYSIIHCGRCEENMVNGEWYVASNYGLGHGSAFPSCKSGDEASLQEYLVDGHLVLKVSVHKLL